MCHTCFIVSSFISLLYHYWSHDIIISSKDIPYRDYVITLSCQQYILILHVISCWVSVMAVSNKAPKVTTVVHSFSVIIVTCASRVNYVLYGSSTALTYSYKVCIQHWYSNNNIYVIYGWLVIETQMDCDLLYSSYVILKNNGVWMCSRIKYTSYHQVSCCINFPPGFTWFVTGNTSYCLHS